MIEQNLPDVVGRIAMMQVLVSMESQGRQRQTEEAEATVEYGWRPRHKKKGSRHRKRMWIRKKNKEVVPETKEGEQENKSIPGRSREDGEEEVEKSFLLLPSPPRDVPRDVTESVQFLSAVFLPLRVIHMPCNGFSPNYLYTYCLSLSPSLLLLSSPDLIP